MLGAGLVVLGGCGAGAQDERSTTLSVFAAASLVGPLPQIADDFEEGHPGVVVQLTFAGSADLAAQLAEGAPADVFAPADEATMRRVVDDGLVAGVPVPVATNTLQIAVPPGNPASVWSFEDLARDGVRTVACADPVPCGAATAALERAAGVALRPVSEETSVTSVLGKVAAGEADAGLVYVTDVRGAAGQVDGIDLADPAPSRVTYPAAVLAGSDDVGLATAFVEHLRAPAAQQVLTDAGFGAP